MEKERYQYMDTAAGIIVLYMIYGHCAQIAGSTDSILYRGLQHLLFYYMAWFFFKAGYFYKINDFRIVLRKSFCRLIIPWGIFTLIGHLIHCLIYVYEKDFNIIHYTLSPIKVMLLRDGADNWNNPLWFLLTLFIVRLLGFYIINITDKISRYLIPVFILITLLIGYSFSLLELTPFYLHNFWIGVSFFLIGFICKGVKPHKKILITTSLVLVLSLFFTSLVDIRTNSVIFGNYFLWFLWSIAGCMFINNFTAIIPPQLPFFTWFGKRSMYFFVLHWPILKLLSYICDYQSFHMNTGILTGIYLIVTIIVLLSLYPFFNSTNIYKRIGL